MRRNAGFSLLNQLSGTIVMENPELCSSEDDPSLLSKHFHGILMLIAQTSVNVTMETRSQPV
jgi:hypothetical protein